MAIAGATNVGKSRLFNAMLRQDRAIVSEIHGTTRDWLEAAINLDGVPVRLYDTAGMRSSTDALEVEGMRRTEQVLGADAVLYLVDGGRGRAPQISGPHPAWPGPRRCSCLEQSRPCPLFSPLRRAYTP